MQVDIVHFTLRELFMLVFSLWGFAMFGCTVQLYQVVSSLYRNTSHFLVLSF